MPAISQDHNFLELNFSHLRTKAAFAAPASPGETLFAPAIDVSIAAVGPAGQAGPCRSIRTDR